MVSGDVHWAELSKQQPAGLYPLYDMTSSGLNMLEFYPVTTSIEWAMQPSRFEFSE